MVVRFPPQPPGEDPMRGTRAQPVPFTSPGTPPGEDGTMRGGGDLENNALQASHYPDDVDDESAATGVDFLSLVRQAESQAELYVQQQNRRAWSQTLRAFHNEHYIGSKYTRPDWRGRSRLFVPKTRAAVRKDLASVAASLFNNVDAITCLPGDEGDMKQRASAELMQELVNYRTSRSSGRAAFPWFVTSMGARMDSLLTGVCVSKQYWKQEFRHTGSEKVMVQDEHGVYVEKDRDVFARDVDRPDMILIAPENYMIDPAADWTNPVQSAAFFIIKYPMQVDEILEKQNAPVGAWKKLTTDELKTSVQNVKFDTEAIRRAREMGLDRFDETQTGMNFQIVWVYENFVRTNGEDYTFFSVGSQHYCTDPKPVRDVYPEQFGERPLALGYGQLESHRIYPMSPAESWQPLQMEVNDLRNLRLDATRQNVMPISKVRRGRQIDLDQVRRRSSGSSILVNDPTDVTWEQSPAIPPTVVEMSRELDVEFDDLAGVQNYGNVQQNNALGKTLGGLKLAAGSANAVQEFDIRVWIETWAQPALAQIVRLEQYYESDAVVLGICGQKAQLFKKYGIDKIDDELLEQDVTTRVSVGLGAGDPQQRLSKFQTAAQIVAPLAAQSPKFQSGQIEINIQAIIDEVFGAAGYKDGGQRFFTENSQPRQNPMQDLQTQKMQAEITKDDRTGQAALFGSMAQLAKVALGNKELEAEIVNRFLDRLDGARRDGVDHALRTGQHKLSAMDHGHRHGMQMIQHLHQRERDDRDALHQPMQDGAGPGQEEMPLEQAGEPPSQPQQAASPDSAQALSQLVQSGHLQFTRDPATGRISGLQLGHPAQPAPAGQPYPLPQAAG